MKKDSSRSRRFKKIVCLLSFLLLFIEAKGQAALFDIVSYDAQIEPQISAKSIKGVVALQFKAMAENLGEISLDAGKLEIDAISENGVVLRFEKREAVLHVMLDRFAKLNETREIKIIYHGVPRFGIKFFPEQNQVYTVFSTSQWMPCVDAPDDRASFRLNLILPKGLKTAANGRFIKQINLPDNKISSEWEQTNPIPTYTFGFAAGKFREVIENHKGVRFRYLATPAFSEKDMQKVFRATADIFDFYESKAGVKYADKVYTQILASGGVEQEMSSFTALNEDYGRGVLKDENNIWLGAHEFAHQWWGNMVTNRDWNHFWLNEGMANFMTAAYLEHRFGRRRYAAEIEEYRLSFEKVRTAGKDKSLVFPDWLHPTGEDRTLVYDKGAYVLHLLRGELGERLFWQGLRDYTRNYWGKSVTTEIFQRSMEKSSGRDLSAFFQKRVYLSKNL